MHLTRESHPLLGSCQARVRVSLPLQHTRPLRERLGIELALLHEAASEPGPAEHHRGQKEIVDAEPDQAGN